MIQKLAKAVKPWRGKVRIGIEELIRHTLSGEEDKQAATAVYLHHHPYCQALPRTQPGPKQTNSSPQGVFFKDITNAGVDITQQI